MTKNIVYPFRRAAARLLDYLLWGILVVVVFGEKIEDIRSLSWILYLSFWLYLFVEAALISLFATTAGKRLMGVYIFNKDGKKLSFTSSLLRSFLVFGGGLGFFLPYISVILPLYGLYRLVKYKIVFWDEVVQDSVDIVKPSLTDKGLLTAFLLFLIFGYFFTARMIFLHREPDFEAIQDSVLTTYFDKIRPQIVEALSEESVLTPAAAVKTSVALEKVQKLIQEQKYELLLVKDELQTNIEKMPVSEIRLVRQQQLDNFTDRMNAFLFSESMRISLFQNILNFFKTADKTKYTVVDGRPVFADKELERQYDNYMTQLQTFLSLPDSE